MSDSALVLREHTGHVLVLTLNRPEKRNALSTPLRQALIDALDAAAMDATVRVVILTGAGEKSFVAGADIAEFENRTPAEQRRVMSTVNIFETVARFRKPVIAAINGYCFGGGLELALACDIRIAAATAQFGQPEVTLGLIPGGGGTQRLPGIVGLGAALKLIMTGLPIDAAEALRLHLVDEVVAPDALATHVRTLADRIASRGPVAVAAAKEAAHAALNMPIAEGLALEATLFQACFSSEDKGEGVRAFLEKRDPHFTGR